MAGGSANVVLGLKPELWRQACPADVPDNLHSFDKDVVSANGNAAPAAQQDLWLWITRSSAAMLYDSMSKAISLLSPFADLVSEQICFPYHNNVTFDGFADGVANPNSFRANSVAIIPDGEKARADQVYVASPASEMVCR